MAGPENQPKLKQEIDKTVAQLRTLRDEIKVRVHLAAQDAQEAWRKLEPNLGDLEKRMTQATESTKGMAQDLLKRFSELRDAVLKSPPKK